MGARPMEREVRVEYFLPALDRWFPVVTTRDSAQEWAELGGFTHRTVERFVTPWAVVEPRLNRIEQSLNQARQAIERIGDA